MNALTIDGLAANIHELPILRGVDLEVPFGQIHAIMGPNGSGKSTLCHVLMGHEAYTVTDGSARLGANELLDKTVDERARLGLLQAFQYPTELPGVTLRELLVEAGAERGIDEGEIERRIAAYAPRLGMEAFLDRSVNDELSGGEKKRSEMLQLAVLEPSMAILDEIDSGLDIDAVREVAMAVEGLRRPDAGILMITHYSRILRYVTPDRVHVMMRGRIVASGGPELAAELDAGGYESLRARLGLAPEDMAEPATGSDTTATDVRATPFDV